MLSTLSGTPMQEQKIDSSTMSITTQRPFPRALQMTTMRFHFRAWTTASFVSVSVV